MRWVFSITERKKEKTTSGARMSQGKPDKRKKNRTQGKKKGQKVASNALNTINTIKSAFSTRERGLPCFSGCDISQNVGSLEYCDLMQVH